MHGYNLHTYDISQVYYTIISMYIQYVPIDHGTVVVYIVTRCCRVLILIEIQISVCINVL